MDDRTTLAKFVGWQAKLQRMEARLNELEELLAWYQARERASETGAPPPSPPTMN